MVVHIYALSDPRTNAIRYVGKTSQSLRHRYIVHVRWCKHNKHKARWIEQLRDAGLVPDLDVLEVLVDPSDKEWSDAERWWISYCRFLGSPLVNLDSGGFGENKRSRETIQKLKASAQRVSNDPVIKADRVRRLKEFYSTQEHRDEARARLIELSSRKRVIEARRANAIARWSNPEWRERTIATMRAPENIAKLSLCGQGRQHSDATKAHLKVVSKERALKPENRTIYSERAKRWNARRFDKKWCDEILVGMACAA